MAASIDGRHDAGVLAPLAAEPTPSAEAPRAIAWDALIARHNPRVIASLVARGVSLDRAREIAQEAWIRLVERERQGLLSRLELPGLAIAQARFLSLDQRRTDAPNLEAAEPEDPSPSAEQRAASRETLQHAQQVLSHCSRSAQHVFRLAYGGDGLSHQEIARQVGLSVQRVRQVLCEVRARLRDALKESRS